MSPRHVEGSILASITHCPVCTTAAFFAYTLVRRWLANLCIVVHYTATTTLVASHRDHGPRGKRARCGWCICDCSHAVQHLTMPGVKVGDVPRWFARLPLEPASFASFPCRRIFVPLDALCDNEDVHQAASCILPFSSCFILLPLDPCTILLRSYTHANVYSQAIRTASGMSARTLAVSSSRKDTIQGIWRSRCRPSISVVDAGIPALLPVVCCNSTDEAVWNGVWRDDDLVLAQRSMMVTMVFEDFPSCILLFCLHPGFRFCLALAGWGAGSVVRNLE
jgi:hypothetical protein